MCLRKSIALTLILLTANCVVGIGDSARADQPGKTNQRAEERPIPGIKEIRQFTGHQGQVVAVAFSPDGKTVASAGNETIRLWDAGTGKERRRFGGHRSLIATLAFCPDGKTLASASSDEPILLWDMATARKRRQLVGKNMEVSSLVFSPDGKYLASVGDAGIELWNLAAAKVNCHILKGNYPVKFSHDNQTLITGGLPFENEGESLPLDEEGRDRTADQGTSPCSAIQAWRLATGKLLPRAIPPVWRDLKSPIAFSPDGRSVAMAHYHVPGTGGFGGGGGLAGLGGIAGIGGIAGLAGASGVAPMGGENTPLARAPSIVHLGLWELASGKERSRFSKVQQTISSAGYSPDGKVLASLSDNGCHLLLWDVDAGRQLCRLIGCRNGLYSVAYSLDGKLLAGAGSDGSVRIWKVPPLTKQPRVKLLPGQLDRLWQELAADDAHLAYRAIALLRRAPRQSARFLHNRLRVVPRTGQGRIARWIAELESKRYKVRRRAEQALEKLRNDAETPLGRALQGQRDLEVRRRVERLLGKLETRKPAAEDLRILRALEVLEHLGTPEAKQALKSLAKQTPRTWWTQEAEAILERTR